jgi:hypothetical protein
MQIVEDQQHGLDRRRMLEEGSNGLEQVEARRVGLTRDNFRDCARTKAFGEAGG